MADAKPPRAATPGEPGALDWTDPAAVAEWLRSVREAWLDAAVVAEDMLRRPRRRDMGPREHARAFKDASGSMAQLLAYAERGRRRGSPL